MFGKGWFFLLLILTASSAYSQCTSGSGAPIVNETFGAGVSLVGPALPAGTTNLQYTRGCPSDGQYTIVNKQDGCYSTWPTVTGHTGDENGYFMVVNASYQPSDFFVQKVAGLCPGTIYQFSTWAVNLVNRYGHILPNVTFTIESLSGAILGTYDTGDIPVTIPYKWRQYGFFFKTPAGVSTVVLRMHNNANGGTGNDLALDDITFTPSGPKMTAKIAGGQNNTIHAFCSNNITFTASVGSCFVQNSYQWQISTDDINWADIAGATTTNYSPVTMLAGTYYYRLSAAENGNIENTNCRAVSNELSIVFDKIVVKNIAVQICPGSVYVLPSGKVISTKGVYADTIFTQEGCYSSITNVGLSIKTVPRTTISVAACEGQDYLGYTKAGTYIDTMVAADGCDSIRTLNLSFKPRSYSTLSAAICQGTTYLGYGSSGTYTDTLVAANGCDSIRTLNLTVKPRAYSTLDISICPGDNYLGYSKAGTYTDTLTAANGCDSIRTINLVVYDKPVPNFNSNGQVCAGDTVLLNPGTFTKYLWQDNSTLPYFKVTRAGTYSVKVTDENGCEASVTLTMTEVYCSPIKIPNTFTPNGDGINDTWQIDPLQYYPACKVMVYSRWGQLVFSSNGYPKPWDGLYNGKRLAVGTYYYIINLGDGSKPLSGFITLIR